MTCPTISPGVRLRTSRIVPVWQKRQLSVQPTCEEMHKRPAIRIGDEHHLIILRVIGAQQPFARAVGRHLRLDDLRAANHEPVGEPGPHGFGNIGHRLERGHTAMVNPVKHLLRAEFRCLLVKLRFFEQLPDLQMAEPHQVDTPVGARRDGAGGYYGVDMAGDLHDAAHIGTIVGGELPAPCG